MGERRMGWNPWVERCPTFPKSSIGTWGWGLWLLFIMPSSLTAGSNGRILRPGWVGSVSRASLPKLDCLSGDGPASATCQMIEGFRVPTVDPNGEVAAFDILVNHPLLKRWALLILVQYIASVYRCGGTFLPPHRSHLWWMEDQINIDFEYLLSHPQHRQTVR